ncbi:MAG: protein-glutamate O-methyltransferase CheR [Planctomycetota bacterium]
MIRDLTGLALDESKAYLIEGRLGPIAEEMGCANLNELYFKMKYTPEPALQRRIIEAITTHETLWFRDGAPFEALQFKMVPESIDAREQIGQSKRLRIWSAACSTGQEPYGIAMIVRDLVPDIDSWNVEIIGTDISEETLEKAREGTYSEHDISRSQRPDAMRKWFDYNGATATVKPEIRNMVTFRQVNLMDSFASLGSFDIVFVRNVLIYFDLATRRKVVTNISRTLLPHGWLSLGSTENLSEVCPEWPAEVHCRATTYRPCALPAPL